MISLKLFCPNSPLFLTLLSKLSGTFCENLKDLSFSANSVQKSFFSFHCFAFNGILASQKTSIREDSNLDSYSSWWILEKNSCELVFSNCLQNFKCFEAKSQSFIEVWRVWPIVSAKSRTVRVKISLLPNLFDFSGRVFASWVAKNVSKWLVIREDWNPSWAAWRMF